MKRLVAGVMLSLAVTAPAFADWDAEAEARREAERAAERRAEEARQRENQRLKDAANARGNAAVMAEKRKYLGAAANGKSDAEVNRLYDAKVSRTTADAYAKGAEAQRKMNSAEGQAALREVTGKSMQDLENMSDAELEALGREMERKYGGN